MATEIRILSTDGKLYKSELWDNSKISQGIAVFDLERNHQFVIGLDSYNCYFCSDSHALKIENAGDWYYEDDDFKDKLDGFNATNSLLRTYTETSDLYVLTYCKALNAYLGTFGEHKIVYENISKIKEAFAVLGKSFNYVEQSTPYIHHVYVDEDPVIGETIEFELVQVSYADDIWNDNLYGGQFYRNDYYLFYKYDGSLEENDVKPKTISENLQIIADSTAAIKQAIIDKGGSIDGDITTWADAISGLSGGGSEEEYVFTGTLTWSLMKCTITGDLSSKPEDMTYGSLIMVFRSNSGVIMNNVSISISIKNLSITCSYNEPPTGNEIPALFIAYTSGYETKIVPVKLIIQPQGGMSGGNPN